MPAIIGRARLLLREGRTGEARIAFERALAIDPESADAHLGLYELLQIIGEPAAALAHQRRVLERNRLFSEVAANELRSLLVLCAPGDWQTNIPVDFLVDRATTTLHKLYLLDEPRMLAQSLPAYDLVLNGIAESDAARPYLELAARFIAAQARPALNDPARVAAIGRRELPQTLAGIDASVVAVREVEREALIAGTIETPFPIIARPVGSHAGHGLERLESPSDAAAYAGRVPAGAYFVSPYVDYAGSDGYFRKYRWVFIEGEPYPVHLAISPNWMIHYYNAPMADHAWMRDEEERFLADYREALGPGIDRTLRDLASRVGLDYFGIDASVGRDGRLLVFEADAAMLVHTTDPVDLYPYKHRYVPRIYRALEKMIDGRKAADTK
jgi:tetratricopeptide (TPR) repeat protein